MIKSYKDFEVYKLSYELAMEIFHLTKSFPKEETYSLTTQIIRSSRSISANLVEGWAKRDFPKKFKLQLIDALGSNSETENWISFARDCKYITNDQALEYFSKLDKIGRMLTKLHQNWKSNTKPSAESVEGQTSSF